MYKHTNKANGKCYIGTTSQRPEARWKHGEGYKSCRLFYRAIQKYTWDGFEHEILYTNLSKSEAEALEISLIMQNKASDPQSSYNLTNGGRGISGCTMSDEAKRKISLARKGKYCGKNSCNYGKHLSEQTRKKMSEAKRTAYCGAGNPFYGMHHTDETKKKISETKLANGTWNDKPVRCIDTGIVYRSISAAFRDTGCDGSAIGKCCTGKLKTSHGLHWEFVLQEGGD